MPSRTRLVAALVAAVVIVLISRDDLDDTSRWWAIAATVAMALTLAWAVAVLQRLLRPGWVPAVLVAVAAISYACVPETDHFRWIVVVPLVMTVVELAARRRLPFGWIFGAAAVELWAGIYGATGRQSALVGALFAWWPVLLPPAVVAVRQRFAAASAWWHGVVAVIAMAAAAVVARTGALESTGGPALRATAIAAAASLAGALLVAWIVPLALSGRDGRVGATPRPDPR